MLIASLARCRWLLLTILAAGFPINSIAENLSTPQAAAPSANAAADFSQYLALAERTLDGIRAQESAKDATCWTTVRMMDQYYALRPIDETAIFLKFEIMKSLLLKLWRAADAKESGGTIELATVKKVIPAAVQDEIPAVDPASILNLDPSVKTSIADFHRITENWRTLLSVLFEQMTGGKKSGTLKIPSNDAADYLAKALTVLNIHLLRHSKQHSEAMHHDSILQDDLKSGYLAILDLLKLPKDGSIGIKEGGNSAVMKTDAAVRSQLLALTRKNIENKVAALMKWNGVAFDPAKDYPTMLERVNKISPLPVTEDGLLAVLEELRSLTQLLAEGKRPMRPDTMSTSGQMFWFENSDQPAYLPVEWIWNVLEETFPRHTDVTGDLEVRIGPNPSRIRKEGADEQIRTVVLRGYELDAIRDTTIHWSTLKDVYEIGGDLYPLEPFAAELLAERLSEIAFFLIKEGERNARMAGADSIDGKAVGSLFKRSVIFIPPERKDYGWKGDYSKEKAGVLKGYPARLFEDVSAAAGIPIPPEIAPDAPRKGPLNRNVGVSLINLTGYGVGIGDYDSDGLPDLFVPGDYKNRLYKNLGNYKFEDVTAASGIDDPGTDSHQSLFADINNDGRLDLFIVHSASISRLFLQREAGRFEDVTADSGIKTNDYTITAAFLDADNDGLLDLFTGSYTGLLPVLGGTNGGGNQFFRNLGNGKFKNVTREAGFGSTTLNLAATAADFDQDGFTDLFVANDFGEDQLYRNIDGKHFQDIAEAAGADDRGSGMNATAVDANYDGFPDLYVTVVDMFSKSIGFKYPVASSTIKLDERIMRTSFYITGNKLLVNQAGKDFASQEHLYFEPGDRGWSWGAQFFDYDNDGDEDMYLTTGWVADTLADNQKKQMFIRSGDRYYLAPQSSPEAFAGNGRSATAADLTNSGRLDLIVANFDSPLRIFKNNSGTDNRSLKVRLKGKKNNRFGIGAAVTLSRKSGQPQTRYITAGSGFMTQQPAEAQFGIPKGDVITDISIRWPGTKDLQRVRIENWPNVIEIEEPQAIGSN